MPESSGVDTLSAAGRTGSMNIQLAERNELKLDKAAKAAPARERRQDVTASRHCGYFFHD